jgi:hypothetical protein
MGQSENMGTIEEVFEEVVRPFVNKKHLHGCLLASVLLAERLQARAGVQAHVVQGFWYSREGAVYGAHYWVETSNGDELDPGAAIVQRVTGKREFDLILRDQQEPKSPPYRRIDQDTEEERANGLETERLYSLYREKGMKAFLKAAPGFIRRFLL